MAKCIFVCKMVAFCSKCKLHVLVENGQLATYPSQNAAIGRMWPLPDLGVGVVNFCGGSKVSKYPFAR